MKLANERFYKISIGGMQLKLTELQANNQQAKEIRTEAAIKNS